jgi:hypothetical protein
MRLNAFQCVRIRRSFLQTLTASRSRICRNSGSPGSSVGTDWACDAALTENVAVCN